MMYPSSLGALFFMARVSYNILLLHHIEFWQYWVSALFDRATLQLTPDGSCQFPSDKNYSRPGTNMLYKPSSHARFKYKKEEQLVVEVNANYRLFDFPGQLIDSSKTIQGLFDVWMKQENDSIQATSKAYAEQGNNSLLPFQKAINKKQIKQAPSYGQHTQRGD